jgi:thiol-disulfide isomerase/thioredoxin
MFVVSPAFVQAQAVGPGDAFPALSDFSLEGEMPDLSGARVVIVDFWASWCGPCKASFPVYDELREEYEDKGLVILAVSVDQNAKAMEQFLKKMKPGFSVVRDADQKLVGRVAAPAMPTSFVLDADSTVRFVHLGFHGDRTRDTYREQIESLLSE